MTYRRADHQWLFGQGRYIYNYLHYDPQQPSLQRLQVFDFDARHRLTRRLYTDNARYIGGGWLFNDGWVYRTGVDLLSEVLGRFEEYARYSLPQIGGTTHGYPRRVDLAAARAMDLRLSTLSDFLAVCRGARVATPTRAAADRRRTAEAA